MTTCDVVCKFCTFDDTNIFSVTFDIFEFLQINRFTCLNEQLIANSFCDDIVIKDINVVDGLLDCFGYKTNCFFDYCVLTKKKENGS